MKDTTCGILRIIAKSKVVNAHAVIFIPFGEGVYTKEQLFKRYQIAENLQPKTIFITYPQSSREKVLKFKTYVNQIISFAGNNNIQQVHFLTQDVFFAPYLSLFSNYRLHYLVHDVLHHTSSTNILKRLKIYYFLVRNDKRITSKIPSLTTCSHHQYKLLQQLYPLKKVSYHSMPGAVTQPIIDGHMPVNELRDIDRYVLFFGKIEEYKGVDILYNIFDKNEGLKNTCLVIAGSGELYFTTSPGNKHIVFINRFIADEEINSLFSKAICLVLPYKSATQSAVSSFAYYYNVPLVASKTPGLTDTIIDGKTALLFNPGDAGELATKLLMLVNDKDFYSKLKQSQQTYSKEFYNEAVIQQQLEAIYTN